MKCPQLGHFQVPADKQANGGCAADLWSANKRVVGWIKNRKDSWEFILGIYHKKALER